MNYQKKLTIEKLRLYARKPHSITTFVSNIIEIFLNTCKLYIVTTSVSQYNSYMSIMTQLDTITQDTIFPAYSQQRTQEMAFKMSSNIMIHKENIMSHNKIKTKIQLDTDKLVIYFLPNYFITVNKA